jgi:tRNA threonylcarbamoyl adenosine modification protein (Sua5/YciO/YrdC/YwlC family)
VDNWQFRLLKQLTPGPYTFILPASKELPKRLSHEKRKTIGIRIPEHGAAQALLELLGEPIISCTLQFPGEDGPVSLPADAKQALTLSVDVVLDAGDCGTLATTVLDLSGESAELIRQGKGDVSMLGL